MVLVFCKVTQTTIGSGERMKLYFFFLGLFFPLLWNLSAADEKFFHVELHEQFFSAQYSPEILEWYAALLGKDFRLVEKPPRNLFLKSNFYLCDGKRIVSPGWESESVTGCDFTVAKQNVKFSCSTVAEVKISPFDNGIAWVLFEVRVTGPIGVVHQYGVAVRRNGVRDLGIVGEVCGFPSDRLLISAGKEEK